MRGSRTGADAAFLCDVSIRATYVHSLCDYTQRCVLKGQIFEMCIKKTASKEKRKQGFSFASEAVLDTFKLKSFV